VRLSGGVAAWRWDPVRGRVVEGAPR
jgi:hypothetical protein